jgi:hypothetical protein
MGGGMTGRPLDYFGLLVAMSVFALVLTSHTEKDETFAETGHNAGANISL